jgi:hypothetical protein
VQELATRIPQGQPLRIVHSGPGDEIRWRHINPDEHSDMHRFGERTFGEPRRGSDLPLPTSESWVVAGYLRLPDLEIDLGDRQSGVVRVAVERRERSMVLAFEAVAVPAGMAARIRARVGGFWIELAGVKPDGSIEIAPPPP